MNFHNLSQLSCLRKWVLHKLKSSLKNSKNNVILLQSLELKNIYISDLIKIGFKFKTNVLLMNEILNLIYEKVFSGRDQH